MTASSASSAQIAAATAAAPAAAVPPRRRGPAPRTVLAIASLGAAVAFVDATIVNIAFPNIEQSFRGTPISSLSWVLNAYNIVLAAFLVAAGRIADLLGRRRIFVLGLELFTIASLLCAIAPSVDTLIAFRVAQALGAACLVPSALALVLGAFPPALRSHGVALLSAVAAAAAGLGPSLGGLLIAADDWRLVFLVNLPIGAAAVLLARRYLVESRAPGRRRMPDLLGALIFALAIGTLVLGVVKGQEWGWTSVRIVACFALALGLGAVFARRCAWHPSPIVDLNLLRVRTFSVANATTIITAAGFYGYTLTNVLFLTGVWRYSVLQAGLALTPGPVVAAAVAGPSSRLVHRIGPRPVLVAGAIIWGAAVLWFVERIGASPDFLGLWLPGIVLLGVGAGTLFPNLSGTAVASAPGESFATATGLNSVSRQVGAALGVAIVVAIIGTPSPLTAVDAFHDAWKFGAACLFVSALSCLLIGRGQRERSPSLGDAAREVLHTVPVSAPVRRSRPRARRAIVLGAAGPRPPRVQSAAEFLAHVPLFAALAPPLRETIATRARPVSVGPGQWVFREGDPGDVMYVVRTGRLAVLDEDAGVTLRELGRGDWVGELGLLTASPRSASVRAARASELLAVAKDDFERLLAGSPALSLAMTGALAAQLRETRAPAPTTRPLATTVSLVALDAQVPFADLAQRLAAALGRHLSLAMLNGSEVAGPAPGLGAADAYAPLLDRAEADHDLVLLRAQAALPEDPWSEFCLQQADRILAFTAGGVSPPLRDRAELRGCDLVLYDVSPGSGMLDGCSRLLEPIESHVVRSDALEADLQRIARRLSGRSVGIVLSGGGARAFSHIGVLEELIAAGIAVDRVAGVSMGAFVGALFAMGLDAEEIDSRCFEEWVRRSPLRDYTVPRHGLIRGERVRAMLHRTFGTVAIEELPRSFMCGCAELRSGRLVVKRWGPLWEGVGFSINIPILAPPQVRGREMLIDGSLVDNLPVHSMAELGEGPIVAVDVKATFDREDGHRQAPAGRKGNEPAGRPRSERVPSLGETITRVLLLGSANTSDAARRHADLVIRPRAEGVGLLEFHQLEVAREAGRDAARKALETAPPELYA